MRRIRRAQRRHNKTNKLFKRKVVTAGAAAAITLAAGVSLADPPTVSLNDKHQLSIPDDTDKDLLADREERTIGYRMDQSDQNQNAIQDGAEVATWCAAAIAELPLEDEVADPNQTYKREMLVYGLETCDVCGESVNMGTLQVMNPRLGLEVELPIIAAHYMEHGSFSYAGNIHAGRVDVPLLLRTLELRFPYEPNEHQLRQTDLRLGVVTPATDDFDGDLLTDLEEMAIGTNLYAVDQNENLVPDGIELAQRCAEAVDRLPVLAADATDTKGVYKVDFMQRGLEWCDVCGESVNMGYWRIVNSTSGAWIDVPEIYCHYMQHGSFSYAGDVHGKGRIDIAALLEILELSAYSDDSSTSDASDDLDSGSKANSTDPATQ